MAVSVSLSATIPAGAAVSNAVDLGTAQLAALISPPAWNNADISFLVSPDNTDFHELMTYESSGVYSMRCMPNCWMAIDIEIVPKAVWVKIRSGTDAMPVPQSADRVFKLVTG